MTGSPYMTSAVWPVASRSKQYAGNRVVKVGGISLNIDADWVASVWSRGSDRRVTDPHRPYSIRDDRPGLLS